jgi:pyrroloquinoline quinone biosynthesis protein E
MTAAPRPYTLIAELTYQCGLRCAYCSNPLDFGRHTPELPTQGWLSALTQAAELGVLQVNFTGGEPLLRDDLAELIGAARKLELYTSLITSGVPLTRERLSELCDAGLDGVQLSVQDTTEAGAIWIAGRALLGQKLAVAGWVKALELPLTLNVVLHRGNISRIDDFIALAERLGARRLELANAQYLSWALHNRSALLPSREQIDQAREVAEKAKRRLRGKLEVLFVLPDYYSDVPKACMSGWGQRYIVVNPTGTVLPCHLAHTLPKLAFENVQERPLAEIWESSPAFQAFRGEDWMAEPCRSCSRRSIDFGGCRCQAFHLAGNAHDADPACKLSPRHEIVEQARSQAVESRLVPLTLRSRAGARS